MVSEDAGMLLKFCIDSANKDLSAADAVGCFQFDGKGPAYSNAKKTKE